MKVLRKRAQRPTYGEESDETSEASASEVELAEIDERAIVLDPMQIHSDSNPVPIWQCYSCGLGFRDHYDFNAHVSLKHSDMLDVDKSMKSKVGRDVKKGRVFCARCRGTFDSHAEHEHRHYSNKVGKGAMIECTNCYKTFETVNEMKLHHARSHASIRASTYQSCCVCHRLFNNRNVRDQHFVTHFPTIVQRIMDKVDKMHMFMGELSLANQCPICGFIVSTRKSLRQHAIFQHVLRSQAELQQLVGPRLEGVDAAELRVVRRVLANPDLLWKRGRQTVSESELKLKTQPKQEVRALDDLDGELLAKRVKLEPLDEVAEEADADEPQPTCELRDFMLRIGVDPADPCKCRICGEDAGDQVLLEVHLAMNHLNLARNRETATSSEDSDSSASV